MPEPDRKKSELESMIKYRDDLRKEWREKRESRIQYKIFLNESRVNLSYADKRNYLRLRKQQKNLSKLIRHVERKISRGING